MSDQDLLSLVKSILQSQIQLPKIPIPIFISEANFIGYRANEYRHLFIQANIKEELIDRIHPLSAMLGDGQSGFKAAIQDQKKALAQWKEQYAVALALRKKIWAGFEFAFEGEELLIEKIEETREGDSREDTIEDLRVLDKLGKANTTLLNLIHFNLADLDKAKAVADELQQLLTDINGDMYATSEEKLFRDQVATQLNNDVQRICRAARFLFHDDQSKLDMFSSKYLRDQGAAYRRRKKEGNK